MIGMDEGRGSDIGLVCLPEDVLSLVVLCLEFVEEVDVGGRRGQDNVFDPAHKSTWDSILVPSSQQLEILDPVLKLAPSKGKRVHLQCIFKAGKRNR